MLLRSCIVIFGCLGLGELIVHLLGISFPASIIGMLLLTFFLEMKWVKLEWVKGISDLLIKNLGLFFVPPSIAIMLYLDIISDNLIAIALTVVISTIIVLFSTGTTFQYVRNKFKK